MLKTLKNAFKVKEIRQRILFTFAMLVVIRIGSQLPVPGVDRGYFANWFAAQTGDAFSFFDAFTGGSFLNMSILALNITPYITSSIIMQLLTIAIPKLEEMQKDGEDGRKKINQYTRYLTLAIATVQAAATTLTLYHSNVLVEQTPWAFAITLISFVAGSMLVMWIGEQITQKGIGNGISLIIFINIVSALPQGATALLSYGNYVKAVILVLLFIIVIGFVVFMSLGERRIAVQYAKRTAGRKVYGGQIGRASCRERVYGLG